MPWTPLDFGWLSARLERCLIKSAKLSNRNLVKHICVISVKRLSFRRHFEWIKGARASEYRSANCKTDGQWRWLAVSAGNCTGDNIIPAGIRSRPTQSLLLWIYVIPRDRINCCFTHAALTAAGCIRHDTSSLLADTNAS